MKYIAILLLMGAFVLQGVSQNKYTKLQGTIVDSTNAPLPVATVVVLQAADSVLYGFNTTDKDGFFEIGKIEPGNYILRVSFIGYSIYQKSFNVDGSQAVLNFGKVVLEEQDQVLDGVDVIADAIPILIKGDTVEYNATSFKTQTNATVEELLKRLPGMEVDREGNVKAQGEDVQKILVNGKEFFGNDPKIATKNLPANSIKKVQVYDRQSDIAEFTGVDDGEREKTINLKLKEDKTDGYFGNVVGGLGTENTYNAKLNLNKFSDKTQLSVLGSLNNINEQSFGMFNNFSMGGGGRGGNSMSIVVVDGSGNNNSGITQTGTGGINYNFELSKNTKIQSSYFYNQVGNDLDQNTFRENFLQGNTYTTDEDLLRTSNNSNHRLNLRVDQKLSEFAQIIAKGNFSFADNSTLSNSLSETLNDNSQIENNSATDQNQTNQSMNITSNVSYMQKFKKAGRSMAMDLNLNSNGILGDLYLNYDNTYKPYDPINGYAELINQFQDQTNNQIDWSGRASFTEPLGKKKYMEFSYEKKSYKTDYDRLFYDVLMDGSLAKDINLSNLYRRDYNYNQLGTTFTSNQNKYNFNLGLNYLNSKLEGNVQEGTEIIIKPFEALLPWFSYRYNFTTSKSLNIRYQTNLNEPSLEQLQPWVDNTDPVNVYVGNPNLRAEYSHRLNVGVHSFDAFSNISFFANISANYTDNKITNTKTIDEFYKQTTTPINVDYDKSLNGFLSFGAPLKFANMRFNVGNNTNLSNSILFINGVENNINRLTYGANISFENAKKEKIDWRIGSRFSVSNNKYSINTNLNQQYNTNRYFADFNWFPGKWNISTSLDYDIYSGSAFGEDTMIPLLKASIARSFLKNDRGELKISAWDILNQYVGISQSSNLNYIQETTYNTLSRYFMLTFTYNLNKFGGPTKGGRGNRMMIMH